MWTWLDKWETIKNSHWIISRTHKLLITLYLTKKQTQNQSFPNLNITKLKLNDHIFNQNHHHIRLVLQKNTYANNDMIDDNLATYNIICYPKLSIKSFKNTQSGINNSNNWGNHERLRNKHHKSSWKKLCSFENFKNSIKESFQTTKFFCKRQWNKGAKMITHLEKTNPCRDIVSRWKW